MTEQEKEKVLHGLDSCGFCDGVPNICEVTECPYREHKGWCVHELAHDAGMLISEMLKAQEPRLVTEADFENADAYGYLPVWVEDKDDSEIVCDCITKAALTDTDSGNYYHYWTSRPTDEQREATPWS